MTKPVSAKINLNLDYVDSNAKDALYYIFCLIQSRCLDVDLSKEKNIREFYERQKDKLINYNSEIVYKGPDFSKPGKVEIMYIFSLDYVEFKHEKYIKLHVNCFVGSETHNDIAKREKMSVSIRTRNGIKLRDYIYGGVIESGKFSEHSVAWINFICNDMPGGFSDLGKIINLYVLNHFGVIAHLD